MTGRKILSVLLVGEAGIAVAAVAAIVALVLWDVVARELPVPPLPGAQRIAVYLMIFVGFLGMGLAAARGRHLRPQFLDGLLPPRFGPMLDRIGSAVMAIVFGAFFLLAIQFLQDAIEYGGNARSLKIPLWTLQLVVPYAFFSITLRYVIYAIHPELRPEEALG